MTAHRQRIAIVGTGISGLTAAWVLNRQHDVTLFESGSCAGGHTNTREVEVAGKHWPVNTGFIVFNDWTYPNFIRLMNSLGVAFEQSDMSFSVDSQSTGLQYNGTSLNTLFAQRRNLFNPRFLRMIAEIMRFNRETRRDLRNQAIPQEETLARYLSRNRYSRYFRDHYIVPMGAAIWSSDENTVEHFPVRFFLQFFNNHGMLSVDNRPTWRVISGGSATYVARMMDTLGPRTRLNTPVRQITRGPEGVTIESANGTEQFDQVVMACHSDQALSLLADPSEVEREILGAIPYQDNEVVLHTDESLLPANRRAWAAWNYRVPADAREPVSVTYNMNILQNFHDAPVTFCVTLNRSDAIAPSRIIERYHYAHPVFTLDAVAAQKRFSEISNHNRTHYCGAYWFNGFHEDGVKSGLRVARDFGLEMTP